MIKCNVDWKLMVEMLYKNHVFRGVQHFMTPTVYTLIKAITNFLKLSHY